MSIWRAGLLLLLAGSGGLGLATGPGWALLPAGGAGLLLLVAAAWGWWSSRHLRFSREVPAEGLAAGQELVQRFTIENGSGLPISRLEVRDRSRLSGPRSDRNLSLGPHQTLSWEASARVPRRGRYRLGPTELRVSDPLGLFRHRLVIPSGRSLVVYPAMVELPDPGAEPGPTPGLGPALGPGWLAEPAPRPRRRSNDRRSQGGELLLLLDLGQAGHRRSGSSSSLEHAVSLAGSVARAATRQGRAVALAASDRAQSRVPAGRGQLQQRALLDFLATARDDGQEPFEALVERELPRWRDRGRVVLITPDESGGWVTAVAARSRPDNRALAILVDPSRLVLPGSAAARASLRLVMDLWVVRHGDDLSRLDVPSRRAVV